MLASNEAETDRLIANEPENVAALIRKADLRAGAGDAKAANLFYRAALKAAANAPVPPALAGEVRRVAEHCRRLSMRFEDYLEDSLVRAGFDASHRPPRFQESIDILLGRREAFMSLQQPRTYYYPGLPQKRYYERTELPWAGAVEAYTDAIRGELLPLVEAGTDFEPYLTSDRSRPPRHGLIDNPDWSSLNLFDRGVPVERNIGRCPGTLEAIEKADLFRLPTRAPQVMFSKLAGGAHIEAHTGLLNVRLVCHLPLIVPDGCIFTVGGEDRQWQEGELLTFDDSVVHEAVNRASSDRVVLIFEIWRPELDDHERAAVRALFDAVDTYQH